MTEMHASICRTCHNYCGVIVETEDGRVASVTGDPDNPIYRGYTCVKGRSHAVFYDHPERLTRTLKRTEEGKFAPIPVDDALGEIAAKLEAIIDRHGPRSVAVFAGTYLVMDNPVNLTMAGSFMKAIGSRMTFSNQTIDQPGKPIAKGLHGMWMAPSQAMHDPEVALLIGNNPLVSHQGRAGHPGDFVKELVDRGAKLIVVDPRRTDIAKRASIFLQPRPGEDVAILAGLIRVIIDERLHDEAFVAENATGFDELREAVEPFTPEFVAHRADVPAEDLVAAARAFGSAARGYATAGTGPNMSAQGTLVEYLILCLHTLCGYWLRAGETVRNALTIVPQAQMAKAQALPPFPAYGLGEPLRIRNLAESLAGPPTAAMADEILLPGDGQIRALLSCGGNPVNCVPDQLKNIEALRSLELLVQTDVQLSPTAALADYVIAAKLPYEMAGTTMLSDFLSLYDYAWGYPRSYAQYTPPIVDPPEGADVIEQWELFYELAQRMGLELELYSGFGEMLGMGSPTSLDMSTKPSTEELFDLIHAGGRIPLDEVKRHPRGSLFPEPPVVVAPKDPGWDGRLDLANAEMMSDLRDVASEETGAASTTDYPFRLLPRRMMHVVNSPTIAIPPDRPPYNPAFMCPSDMDRLGLASGDVVKIRSARATILAIVQADANVREATISISHSFGDVPERDEDVRRIGSTPGRLIASDDVADRYSGQPRMSNIPVSIERHVERQATAPR